MKSTKLFARLGVVAFFVLISGRGYADLVEENLHQLYMSGKYFKCYRAARKAAVTHKNSPVPHFYAALALCRYDRDPKLRQHVRAPYDGALEMLGKAKELDPAGKRLYKRRKGLRYIQKLIFTKVSKAWKAGKTQARAYFDKLHSIFSTRTGTWANIYHGGRELVHPDYDFPQWDNPFYRLANTARDDHRVPEEIRQVIYLHNLCRANPQLFRDTYVKKYVGADWHDQDDYYVRTLKEDLAKAKPVQFLNLNSRMVDAAKFHRDDMLNNGGALRHSSSDGTSFGRRLDRFVPNSGAAGENCAAGYNDPLSVFMGLMIDRGVESLGHRRNIMNGGYKHIGFAAGRRKGMWMIWVFDFSSSV